MNVMADLTENGVRPAEAAGASVAFQNVEKRYGAVTALRPTSLDIAAGEFFAIIGPSGSGKSTLLGITAGFIPPSGGRIQLDGSDIVNVPAYRRNIGMVFQNYSLFPHMTVGENIAFPLRMRKVRKAEIAARVDRMLAVVRLSGFAKRRPSELSGGQQQRVALARAAVYDPLLLLMDEPLGALDKNLREEMQEEIKRFQAELGATVLYVTHDQDEAAAMADRIAIMHEGQIVQVGSPRALYEAPRSVFVATFLGEANILRPEQMERVDGGGVGHLEGLTVRTVDPHENADGGVICVRPEDIQIANVPLDLHNNYRGEVVDVVYTAGSVRYRVKIAADTVLTVRLPSHHGVTLHEVAAGVSVGWSRDHSLVIAGEG